MTRYQRIARRLACVVVLLAGSVAVASQQKRAIAAASVVQLEAAIKRDPRNPKTYVALGLAYWDRNDYRHALTAFQRAVQVGPTSAEAHNWLGVALADKADLPGAVAEFRKSIALDPKYGRAYTNLGSALAKSGDFAEAVEVFQKALALEPNSLAAHMNLGLALREKGDLQAALIHLRRVAAVDANSASTQYELGQTLRQSGDLAAAIAAFERALEINPELREGYYGLGLALKQQSASVHKVPAAASPADEFYKWAQESVGSGDLDAAKKQLSEALRADERHADSHNLLGYILGQQGDLTSGLTHLERAVALQPNLADAHYNFGVALWYSGSKERAISELRESVRLDPAAAASYAFLGNVLRDTQDLASARLTLQRAIALLPPTTAVYVDLGIVFLHAGELDKALGQFEAGMTAPAPSGPTPDWDAAIAALRGSLVKTQDRPDAHNMLGLLLGQKGAEPREVLAEFRKAVRLRPNFAEAHNNAGLVLAQSDDDTAAIKEFREAIRIRPDYADAHANLGATLITTDLEQAIAELEKAVVLQPNSAKALFNLAEAYGRSPNRGPAKQIEALRKVVSIAPAFARARLALGKALLQDGKVADAVTELQQAARLDPQSGEAHYQLGLALARAGKQEQATVEVQRGRELSATDERNQNTKLDIAEGRAALDKGQLDQATAKFQQAIKLQPDSSEAQHYVGVVLEKRGDAAGAAAAYQKALALNPGDVTARQSLDRLTLPDAPAPQSSGVEPTATVAPGEDDPEKIAELEGYIRESRFEQAEPLLAEYVKQHPKSDWGWYALGYSQFAQKKVGESIKSLAESLQLNVKNAEAHKILGRDLMIIGRFDAAQTEFEQGTHYNPNSAEMHYNLGKLFSMQDSWESARQQFEEALRIEPTYLEAMDALGFAQEALGEDTAAVASYQKAIALNEERHGKFASAHANLSAYYNRTGDADKALDYARKALELDPKSDPAWFQMAKAHERQGRLDEAVDSLSHAISLNPRASSYYYVLANVYRRLGKKQESRRALSAFTQLERETNELEKKKRSVAHPASPPPAGGNRD